MKRLSALPCLLAFTFVTASSIRLLAQAAPATETAEHAHAAAQPSVRLTLTIDGKATIFSVADLEAMPQRSITVHNEHTKSDQTYSGVLLGDLLAKSGFAVGSATHRQMLRSYLIAEGTDRYWVLYSLTEVQASEHKADVLVATRMDGEPLAEDGALKLIDSADTKPQRWVRNLTAITIKSADALGK